MPLKKSIVGLISDVFNTAKLTYGNLGVDLVAEELVRKWFPRPSDYYDSCNRGRLIEDFSEVRGGVVTDNFSISLSLRQNIVAYSSLFGQFGRATTGSSLRLL